MSRGNGESLAGGRFEPLPEDPSRRKFPEIRYSEYIGRQARMKLTSGETLEGTIKATFLAGDELEYISFKPKGLTSRARSIYKYEILELELLD